MCIKGKKRRQIHGFDYRVLSTRAEPGLVWAQELAKAESDGGYVKRIAGDLSAFDKTGKVLFEVYDQD